MDGALCLWLPTCVAQQQFSLIEYSAQCLDHKGGRNLGHTSQGLSFPTTYDLLGKCALCQPDSCLESRLKVKPC